MKHYPHHIGDFDKATRHLTRIERSIYRDLMDLYYDTEKQLSLDLPALCRRICANDLATDVERTLNEFFVKTDTGWYHDRCEVEIEAYRANNSQRAQAGKASAAAKALKKQQALNGDSTDVERALNERCDVVEVPNNGASTNQSTNQPINQSTKEEKTAPAKRSPTIPIPDGVDSQVWSDWLQLRKTKKAPVTQTVVDGASEQAAIAGMILNDFLRVWCRRGSQGLEAAWLKPDERSAAKQPKSFAERDREVGIARWEEQTGRVHPDRAQHGQHGQYGEAIDVTHRILEIEQ